VIGHSLWNPAALQKRGTGFFPLQNTYGMLQHYYGVLRYGTLQTIYTGLHQAVVMHCVIVQIDGYKQ